MQAALVSAGLGRALRLAGLLALGVLGLSCWKSPVLPNLGVVPAFTLLDQDGRALTQQQLRGHVWIANFMFTSCPDVCPLLTARLAQVRTQLAAERATLRLVSFSVDAAHDSAQVLKKYAVEHGADQPDWRFATGPVDQVERVIVAGFKQALQPLPAAEGKARTILHGSHFVLVDSALQMRGFYSTDEEGLMRLVRDARGLVRADVARH